MAGVITTGNHPKALWPGVKAWWGRQYNEHPVEYTDLFDVETSDKPYEELVELTGFGLGAEKQQGRGVRYDSESQGPTTRSTHVTYGLGYIVTAEEISDNQYEIVGKRRSRANAFSMRQTKENVSANVYNRAFNSNYTFGDGVELCSTAHVTKSGSQSNHLTVASDICESALEDLCIQIMTVKNSRGLRFGLRPRMLIVHPNDYFEATRILKSEKQSGIASNDVNALKLTGMFPEGIKVNHYLTDTDAYFIRTTIPQGTGAVCFNRWPIKFTRDNDFDTDNAKAKAIERYSFTIGDWRAVFGSPGA